MKICLTCSHGGHLTEILKLMDAFKGQDVFFITYEGMRAKDLGNKYTMKNLGMNPLRFLISIPKEGAILGECPVIFVTVGNHYQGFERLVRKMDEIAGRIDEKVIMQIGTTEYKPVNAKYFDFIESFEEIERLNRENINRSAEF